MRMTFLAATALVVSGSLAPLALRAQQTPAPAAVTFTKDVAPILQRSCENCHRADGVAPMSLRTYEEARPWARAIKQRTGIGPPAGVLPAWYVTKNLGLRELKKDPSFSACEIALIPKWAYAVAHRRRSPQAQARPPRRGRSSG